ncbi:unnamed protein product, partial [Rotaria sp. Silwood2]
CLSVLLNLLQDNTINQNYFKEHPIQELPYLKRLNKLFKIDFIHDEYWSPQKMENIHLLLQIIQTLTSPTNSKHNIIDYQRAIRQYVRELAFNKISKILTSSIEVTIADVIDGSAENKRFLDSVMNNYGIIQQSVLYNLLNVMINGRNKPFELRIAILYFLRCYLYQNEFGKNMIISTLSYQSEIANHYTLGSWLINGYVINDVVASWCSSIGFSCLIGGHFDKTHKEEMLKVVISIDQSPINGKTLMELSTDLLKNLISQVCLDSDTDDRGRLIQSLCAFVLCLCISSYNKIGSYSSDSIKQLICKEINIKSFQEIRKRLSESEFYVKAFQNPQLKLATPDEMALTYDFTQLHEYTTSSTGV